MSENKWKDWQQFFNEEGASDVQLVGDYYYTEMINMEELYQIFKARLQSEKKTLNQKRQAELLHARAEMCREMWVD